MRKTAMFLGMLAIGFANAQYDGKVGINTETPSATLNVVSLPGNSGGKNLELQSGTNRLLTVRDNGKVGINYDNPQYLLDIKGTGGGYNENSIGLRIFRESTLSGGLDFFKARGTAAAPAAIQKGDYLGSIGFTGYNGTNYLNSFRIAAIVTGDISTDSNNPTTSYDSSLHFMKETGIAAGTILMTIHHTGNVGIGTSTPTEALHVIGKARIQGLNTNAGSTTDKVVVVDNTGVLKSVDRSTLGGGATTTVISGATNGLAKSGDNVKLGGTLTEATTITQDTHELKITGKTGQQDKDLRFIMDTHTQNNKAVYVNLSSPITGTNGNLRKYEGNAVPNYQPNDYMIILTNNQIHGKLQLPSASQNPGRIIYLINGTTQGLNFDSATADTIPFNFSTLNVKSSCGFISDGIAWYPLGR